MPVNTFVCFGKQEAETPSQEVALLLHRKGFDCGSVLDVPLQCTWSTHEEVTCAHIRCEKRKKYILLNNYNLNW